MIKLFLLVYCMRPCYSDRNMESLEAVPTMNFTIGGLQSLRVPVAYRNTEFLQSSRLRYFREAPTRQCFSAVNGPMNYTKFGQSISTQSANARLSYRWYNQCSRPIFRGGNYVLPISQRYGCEPHGRHKKLPPHPVPFVDITAVRANCNFFCMKFHTTVKQ